MAPSRDRQHCPLHLLAACWREGLGRRNLFAVPDPADLTNKQVQEIPPHHNQTNLQGSEGQPTPGETIMNIMLLGFAMLLVVAFCAAVYKSREDLVAEYDAEVAAEAEAADARLPLLATRTPAKPEKTPAATYTIRHGYGYGHGYSMRMGPR
nr:hypothetical protein CFP56_50970 [Quercus suber]